MSLGAARVARVGGGSRQGAMLHEAAMPQLVPCGCNLDEHFSEALFEVRRGGIPCFFTSPDSGNPGVILLYKDYNVPNTAEILRAGRYIQAIFEYI